MSGKKEGNYNKIKNLIIKLKMQNNVKFVGHVDLNKLLSLYDNCDSVVYPSFSGPENLPPLEALARKKKAINSIYPGAREQLKNFVIYFNPISPDEIAIAMKKTYKMKSPRNLNKLNKFLKLKKSDIYIEKLIKYLD